MRPAEDTADDVMVWDRRRTCREVGWSYRTWLRLEARGEGPPRFWARGQWWYRPPAVRQWLDELGGQTEGEQ